MHAAGALSYREAVPAADARDPPVDQDRKRTRRHGGGAAEVQPDGDRPPSRLNSAGSISGGSSGGQLRSAGRRDDSLSDMDSDAEGQDLADSGVGRVTQPRQHRTPNSSNRGTPTGSPVGTPEGSAGSRGNKEEAARRRIIDLSERVERVTAMLLQVMFFRQLQFSAVVNKRIVILTAVYVVFFD